MSVSGASGRSPTRFPEMRIWPEASAARMPSLNCRSVRCEQIPRSRWSEMFGCGTGGRTP